MRRPLLLAAGAAAGLTIVPAANAGPLAQLYAPIHIRPKAAPSPAFINSHFRTISIHHGMAKSGYRVPRTGYYVKGTRSPSARHPESWYLHGRNGARVRDRTWGFFVMNPANPGWRAHVARQCRASFCFLDSLGQNGYQRAWPQPRELSLAGWTRAAIGLAQFVESRSSAYDVVANNLITAGRTAFDVGYEMFARTPAKVSLAILRRTTCYCFAKLGTERGARYGFTLFLSGADPSDRISVGTDHQIGKWWPFFNRAGSLGEAIGPAKVDGAVNTRRFTGGTVVVNTGRSAQRVAVAGAGAQASGAAGGLTVPARDGMILTR